MRIFARRALPPIGPVFLVAVLTAGVLLAGCGTSAPSGSGSTPDSDPTETVKISVEPPPSTVAVGPNDLVASAVTAFGQTGESSVSVYVFANGRVLSTDAAQAWGFREFKISVSRVTELQKLASTRGLLQPREAGDPGITDQDTLVTEVLGPTGLVSQRVYAPGFDDGLTTSEKATREDIGAFALALRDLPKLPEDQLVEAVHPYVPTMLKALAYPVLPVDPNAEEKPAPIPVAWGARQPLSVVFADADCVVVSGADAEWLRTTAGESSKPIFVQSSVPSPRLVRVVAEPAETSLYPCFGDTQPPVETAWTSSGRSVATPIDRWAAETVLHRYAYEGKLGEDYASDARLTYLELRYARVVNAGRAFVDLVATDRYSSKGPFRVTLRVDPATGEVIEFEVTEPVG